MKNIFRMKRRSALPKVILCILVMTVSLSGCEPLRKKFIRKKKKDNKQATDFVPVLEPIDYPEHRPTAESKYKHHYQLWRVWQNDLITALEENQPKKRLKYIVSQIIGQLEEMNKLISEEKQKLLIIHIQSYKQVEELVNMPDAMRHYLTIERKSHRIGRALREHFVFAKMKNYIQKQ